MVYNQHCTNRYIGKIVKSNNKVKLGGNHTEVASQPDPIPTQGYHQIGAGILGFIIGNYGRGLDARDVAEISNSLLPYWQAIPLIEPISASVGMVVVFGLPACPLAACQFIFQWTTGRTRNKVAILHQWLKQSYDSWRNS